MATLVGNEVLYVIGLDNAGRLAATTEQTTTGAIAALAGSGSSGIISTLAFDTVQDAVTAAYTSTKPLLINNASTTNTTNIGGITVLPGSVLNAATASGNPGVSLILNDMIIDGFTINETGSSSTAIQMNSANVNNITLVNGRVSSLGYSYLHNDALADGSIFANNYVSAGFDGPNYNHPNNPGANVTNIGNIIDTAGFGIAIAQVNSYNMIGNIIRSSSNTDATVAALHVEDLNTGGIVLGNHAMNCKGEGFSIQVPTTEKGIPGPMTSGFNQLRFIGDTKTDYIGINCVNDANGGITQMGCIGSVIDGFDTGIVVSDTQDMFVEGTIINNCNTGLGINKHGRAYGLVSCQNTVTLVNAGSGSMCGGFSSQTTPTHVVVKGGSNFPGPAITSDPCLRLPIPVTHAGSSDQEWFIICPAPSGLQFKGICKATVEGSNGYYFENEYLYDGTTLTPLYAVNSAGDAQFPLGLDIPGTGTVSAAAFRVDSGNWEFGFTSSAAITQTGWFEFVGTWIQNT